LLLGDTDKDEDETGSSNSKVRFTSRVQRHLDTYDIDSKVRSKKIEGCEIFSFYSLSPSASLKLNYGNTCSAA
jgi:hypothetical protein